MGSTSGKVTALLTTGVLALALAACGGGDDNDSGSASPSGPAPAASAGPLTLDTTFGTGGISALPLSTGTHDRFMAAATGSDGKTYAAGYRIDNGDQVMIVARIDDKGALDKTFGTDGVAVANAAAGGKTAELARAVVVQSSGKIVVAGVAEHDVAATGDAARDTDIAVARFDNTGKLDTTFGTGGIAKIDLGAGRITTGTTFVGDNAWGLGTLPGDKLVVFGSMLAAGEGRTDSDFVLAGLTSAGAVDTAFGTNGRTVVDVERTSGNPRHMIVQSDGKIVGSGYQTMADGVVQPVAIRTDSAGKLDTTFGTNGVATARVLPGVAESYAIQQQGSDYILAGYGRGADATEKVDLIVYRFKGNGSWDTSFGKEGITRIDITKEDDRGRNLLVLPDGRILAVGSGKKSALDVDAMMVLLTKDGAAVSGFGENGALIHNLGGTADAWYGVALSADKKFVIVAGYKGTEGSGNDDAAIARFKI